MNKIVASQRPLLPFLPSDFKSFVILVAALWKTDLRGPHPLKSRIYYKATLSNSGPNVIASWPTWTPSPSYPKLLGTDATPPSPEDSVFILSYKSI